MYYQKVPITVFSFQLDDFPSVRKICNGKPVTYVYKKKKKTKEERKKKRSFSSSRVFQVSQRNCT